MSGNTVYLCPVSECFTANPSLLANGSINVNGNVSIYLAGTTTPANTYTANGGVTLNPNPMQLTVTGRLVNQIWQLQGQAVKIVVADQLGNSISTDDNLLGIDDPSFGSSVANSAYNAANAAYTQANTATTYAIQANRTANAAYIEANSAANTVAVYANAGIILAAGNLTFNNSATINVSAAANGTFGTNIALTANTSGIGIGGSNSTANGFANLTSNVTLMWGSFPVSASGGVTANNITFAAPFQSACYSLTMTLSSAGTADGLVPRVQNLSRTGFSLFNDQIGTGGPWVATCFWQAIGF